MERGNGKSAEVQEAIYSLSPLGYLLIDKNEMVYQAEEQIAQKYTVERCIK